MSDSAFAHGLIFAVENRSRSLAGIVTRTRCVEDTMVRGGGRAPGVFTTRLFSAIL